MDAKIVKHGKLSIKSTGYQIRVTLQDSTGECEVLMNDGVRAVSYSNRNRLWQCLSEWRALSSAKKPNFLPQKRNVHRLVSL